MIEKHLIPVKNESRKVSWVSLMNENKFIDTLMCPISEAALRNVADVCSCPSSIKKKANIFFYNVTGALTNPYTVIHRFFVAGDYGRKTSVGDFTDLRLIAYVNENPPFDTSNSKSDLPCNKKIHQILMDHFAQLQKSGNCIESYSCQYNESGDVVVKNDLDQKITIRFSPEIANPCSKHSNNFRELRDILSEIKSFPSTKGSIQPFELDKRYHCYFEELACRLFSSFPEGWLKFIRLCVYISRVYKFGYDEKFIENLCLKILILNTENFNSIVLCEKLLLEFLNVNINLNHLRQMDRIPLPNHIHSLMIKHDKVSLCDDDMEELTEDMNNIMKSTSSYFKNHFIVLRSTFRPFHNIASKVTMEDIEKNRIKCKHMISILKDETMTINDLLNVNSLKDQSQAAEQKKMTEILKHENRVLLPRMLAGYLIDVSALIVFICLMIFGYTFYHVNIYNNLNEELHQHALQYRASWLKLNKFVSVWNEENQYAKIFFSSNFWNWIEDCLEDVMYENPFIIGILMSVYHLKKFSVQKINNAYCVVLDYIIR